MDDAFLVALMIASVICAGLAVAMFELDRRERKSRDEAIDRMIAQLRSAKQVCRAALAKGDER